MKKLFQRFSIGYVVSGLFMFLGVVAFAASVLFFTQNRTTDYSKKTIFQSDMSIGASSIEVAPGDSVAFAPYVHNDATEEMYAFLKITMPVVEGDNLYEFAVGDKWMEVESNAGVMVYAYVDSESNMCVLNLDETTPTLTTQITMRSISNALYAGIDDINVSVDSYVIGIDGVSSVPQEAWTQCKAAGAGS